MKPMSLQLVVVRTGRSVLFRDSAWWRVSETGAKPFLPSVITTVSAENGATDRFETSDTRSLQINSALSTKVV